MGKRFEGLRSVTTFSRSYSLCLSQNKNAHPFIFFDSESEYVTMVSFRRK